MWSGCSGASRTRCDAIKCGLIFISLISLLLAFPQPKQANLCNTTGFVISGTAAHISVAVPWLQQPLPTRAGACSNIPVTSLLSGLGCCVQRPPGIYKDEYIADLFK